MNAIEFVEMLNNRVRNSVVSIVESDLGQHRTKSTN